MANAEQIKALLKSHVQGDDDRFFAIVLQMAAQEARNGHGKLALELRDLVDTAKRQGGEIARPRNPVPVVQPRGELSGLISVSFPDIRLSDVILSVGIHAQIYRVVLEHHQQHKLRAHGLSPRRKVLLIGPPGTGKTLTAGALAGEMGMPLCTILLHGLITKYMGETAAKLSLVFDAFQKTRGVYLFDELDAIGGKRSMSNDVGEIRRVLNSFLQFMENDKSDSIMIAATNHAQLLDEAIFRRFDDIIEYEMPTADSARKLLQDRLSAFNTEMVEWSVVSEAAKRLSYAEITRAADDAAKLIILNDQEQIHTSALLRELESSGRLSNRG